MGTQIRRILVFLFHPRRVIRELVGTRPWRVVVACSLIAGVLFSWISAYFPLTIFPTRASLMLATFAATSLLWFLVFSMNGLLRSLGGRRIGGRATAGELSAALALSSTPLLLWVALAWSYVTVAARLAGHQVLNKRPPFAYLIIALGAVCLVWRLMLGRTSVFELQGFTPAQGSAAASRPMVVYTRLLIRLILLALAVIAIFYAMTAQHIR